MAKSRKIQIINEIQDNLDKIENLNPEEKYGKEQIISLCSINLKLNIELDNINLNG